jgi:hypothetical protein
MEVEDGKKVLVKYYPIIADEYFEKSVIRVASRSSLAVRNPVK